MSRVIVVENPKRRRRRPMSALQRRYFGKRRGRRVTRRAPARRRRRNPVLASLAGVGNPRRRYRRRTQYVRGYRRRRNPRMGFLPVSFMDLTGLTIGAVGSKIVPGMIRNFFPQLPVGPVFDIGIKVGSGWLMSMAAGMMMDRKAATNVFTGALVAIAVDLWNQYGAPMTGLGDYYDGMLSESDWAMVSNQPQIGEYFRENGNAASAQIGMGEYVSASADPLTNFAY